MNKLTLLGIIIAGIGNIFGLWLIHKGNANESTSKNNTLIDKLKIQENQISLLSENNEALEGKIDDLSSQNIEQKTELTKLRKNNEKLNKDLSKAQATIISKFTGDDNYGIVGLTGVLCGNNFCYQLSFENLSRQPIYDVQVRYYNVEESERSMKNGIATIETQKLHIRKNIGNVTPSLLTPISEPKVISENGEHYIFYIGARNGIYYQESFLFPSKNGLISSISRIMKYNQDKNKYEELRSPYHHPEDFPLKRDEVNWKLDFEQ